MEHHYAAGRVFEREDFRGGAFEKGEYEDCRFINCNFNRVNLTETAFIECEFIDCDLSLSEIALSRFNGVSFKKCKLLGLRFDTCNNFGFSVKFSECDLSHASFYNMKIKKTVFAECIMHECDFAGSDLSSADFSGSDFLRCIFENTILEKADFSSASNFIIDPEKNKIKKALFSLGGLPGLLSNYDISVKI